MKAEVAALLDKAVSYHRYLIDAQDLRNLGDYGVGTGVTRAQLADLLAWSDEFLTAATAFLQGSW